MFAATAPTPFDLRYSLDGYIRFTDPDGFPAITPPWGTLTAIDMNRAAIAWQVPLGEVPGRGSRITGSENYGGPVVTASGLLFIGATNYDRKFRAFDAHTGKVLWETTLPAAGNATPAVYEANGKQDPRRLRRAGQVGRAVRRQLCRVCAPLSGPISARSDGRIRVRRGRPRRGRGISSLRR